MCESVCRLDLLLSRAWQAFPLKNQRVNLTVLGTIWPVSQLLILWRKTEPQTVCRQGGLCPCRTCLQQLPAA